MIHDGSKDIETYLEQKPEDLQKVTSQLAHIILSIPDMTVAIKWGKPTFAFNNDFHHWICSLQVLKNSVSLIFHFGGLLDDEGKRLIVGTSKFLRKIEYTRLDDINEEEINQFIRMAIDKLPYFKANWKQINKEID